MNKDLLPEIYSRSSNLLLAVIDDITKDEISYKPSEESRSIAEMLAHIVRVDNYFLKKLGTEGQFKIPDLTLHSIHKALKDHFNFMAGLISNGRENDIIIGDDKHNNWHDRILHICQHYLYHFSQMVYLRRVKNRDWESPLHQWEEITYIISSYLRK